MRPNEAASYLARAAARLEIGAVKVVRETLDDVLETAINHSSGATSTAELRRQDHPFARRHGSPQADVGIVNRQSGEFAADWDTDGPNVAGGTVSGSAFNTSDHARYLYDPEASKFPDGGTELAFGRPLPEEVIAECEPRFTRRAQRHIDDSFR